MKQSKQDEMSEMQIRKELAEKKLSSAARDQELQVEKLNRKLEDAHNQLKRYCTSILNTYYT